MYKGQAQSEQFATRSGSESTKGSVKGFDLLDHGVNPVQELTSGEVQQSALLAVRRKLTIANDELTAAKELVSKLYYKNNREQPYLDAIANEKKKRQMVTEIHKELTELNQRPRAPRDITQHFVDAAKDILTKAQFIIILNEAKKRRQQSIKNST